MEENRWQRSEIVLGKKAIEALQKKHVVVCGIGGVGSYALEAFARSGIGTITLIDKDEVDITNCNRQLIALQSTIGKDKVQVAKDRIQNINPNIGVKIYKEEITADNITILLQNKKVDYVVDAVDNIEAKVAIIGYCYRHHIDCISCMGMGNKCNPLDIKVADIYQTTMCPLAKIMRKRLKELQIPHQKVVYSTERPKTRTEAQKAEYGNTLGSLPFVPSVGGLIMASCVVQDLIEKIEKK